MSGLETAIRNALDRADRSNAEVRARIYQSARQALETGLRKQDVTDPAIVAAQRHRLESTIKTIEHEERQRLGVELVDPVADIPYEEFEEDLDGMGGSGDMVASRDDGDGGYGDDLGSLRAERLGERAPSAPAATAPEPVMEGRASGRPSGRVSGRASGNPSGNGRPRKRRGRYARLFIIFMLLAFLAMGGWWAYSSGLFLTAAERDTSVANPPAAVSEEDLPADQEGGGNTGPALDSANSFSKDWIEIFKPGDVDQVSAGDLATAQLTTTGDGPVIRITSTSTGADGAVRILLPQEALKQVKGEEATIALSMRSATDKPVEVTVDCDLAGQGTCERHRFTVNSQRTDALIQVTVNPGGNGGQPALVFNSAVEDKGGGVDLVAVRLLPSP